MLCSQSELPPGHRLDIPPHLATIAKESDNNSAPPPPMKCSRLLSPLALALSLAWAEPADLSHYPAEQVRAVQAHNTMLQEANAILAGNDTPEQKIEALQGLIPRMQEAGHALQSMSTQRTSDINERLNFKVSDIPALARTLHGLFEEDPPQPLTRATMEFIKCGSKNPWPATATTADIAACLLRCIRELEAGLCTPGRREEERVEALRLYREKLIYLYAPLQAREKEQGALSCHREVEAHVLHTPGAQEALPQHLSLIRRMRDASAASAELAEALAEYESCVSNLVVHTLNGLTEEGRQRLITIRDFVREHPHLLQGDLETVDEETAPNVLCLANLLHSNVYLHLEEEASALADYRHEIDELWENHFVLVSYDPARVKRGSDEEPHVYGVRFSDILQMKCTFHTLNRALEGEPELGNRVRRWLPDAD